MKNRSLLLLVVCVFALSFVGCGEKSQPSPKQEVATASEDTPSAKSVSVEKKTVDPAKTGSLMGRISFDGVAPTPKPISIKGNPECAMLHPGGTVASEELLVKDGAIQNAFIYIKQGLEGYEFAAPKEPVTVSNKECVYLPHVVGVQVGQPVEYRNEDATLHNVHAFPKINKGFNLGLPFANMKQTKTFTEQEIMVPLKCDVHPWMLGYVGVVRHPYFAVTGPDGSFDIKNIPAGEYEVEVWHEKLGAQSLKIKIEPQASETLNFTFKQAPA